MARSCEHERQAVVEFGLQDLEAEESELRLNHGDGQSEPRVCSVPNVVVSTHSMRHWFCCLPRILAQPCSCASPVASGFGYWEPTRSSRLLRRVARHSTPCDIPPGRPIGSRRKKVLAVTLRSGRMPGSWNIALIPEAMASPGWRKSRVCALRRISPASCCNTPLRLFTSVALPAPFWFSTPGPSPASRLQHRTVRSNDVAEAPRD